MVLRKVTPLLPSLLSRPRAACCFSFLAVRCPCWQENPPHPRSHGLDTEMGLRGGRGQWGKRKRWQRKGTLRVPVVLARRGRRWLAAPSHCLTTCPQKNHSLSAKNETMALLDTNTCQKDACCNIRCVLLYLNFNPLVLYLCIYL